MKIASDNRSLETSNLGATSEYKIAATAKAFKVLTGNLYKDPILAIIRELSANALDAQLRAGNEDKPFDIHLPTDFNPTFKVRDYGISMDDHTIHTLYTTVFGSDKTGTNLEVGGLGLGSKTPLAYTDVFTVRAFLDGSVRTYSVYKNEAGTPTLSLIETQDTDEPNGIEVSLAVKSNDVYQFADRARTALRWFNPRPNLTGHACEIPDAPTTLFHLDDVDIITRPLSNSIVLMGPVAYKLDVDMLTAQWKNTYPIATALATSRRLVLHGNIGDYDIAPSREELHYDKPTVRALQKTLQKTEQQFKTIAKDYIAEAKSLREAMQRSQELQAPFGWSSATFLETHLMLNPFKWKGYDVSSTNYLSWEIPAGTRDSSYKFPVWGSQGLRYAMEYYHDQNYAKYTQAKNRSPNEEIAHYIPDRADPTKATIHFNLHTRDSITAKHRVLARTSGLFTRRIVHWLHTSDIPPEDYAHTAIYLIPEDNDTLADELSKHLEFTHEFNTNDVIIPKAPRTNGPKTQYRKGLLLLSNDMGATWTKEETVDITKLDNPVAFRFERSRNTKHSTLLMLQLAAEILGQKFTLVGVNTSLQKRFTGAPWAEDLVPDLLKRIFTDRKYRQILRRYAFHEAFHEASHSYSNEFWSAVQLSSGYHETNHAEVLKLMAPAKVDIATLEKGRGIERLMQELISKPQLNISTDGMELAKKIGATAGKRKAQQFHDHFKANHPITFELLENTSKNSYYAHERKKLYLTIWNRVFPQ